MMPLSRSGRLPIYRSQKNENPNATEPHRGFAYVEYEDVEDAKEAIDNMDQSELFGRVIKAAAAKAPKSTNEGLGSLQRPYGNR